MPKASFEFNLPEEQSEFEITSNAGSFHSALQDVASMFRQKYKHVDPPSTEALMEFEALRTRFYEILDDNEIKLF